MAINNKPLGSPNSPTDLTQTLPNGSGGTESVAAALVDHNTTEENFQEALLHTATQVDQTQIDLGYPEPGATRPGTVDSRLDALEGGTVTPTAMSGADVTGPANNLQIQPLAVGTPELGLHAVTGGEMGKIAENTVTNRELANTDVRFNIGDNTTPVTATLGAADADLNAIPVFSRDDDGVVPNPPAALADDHRVLNDDGNWRKIESWALSETELIPSHRVEATGEARGNYATTTAMATAAETARTTSDPWQPNDTATVTDSGTSQVTTYVFLGYPSASGTPTSISNFSALGSVDSYGAGLGLSLDSTSNQFSVTTPTFAAGTNYFYRGMSSGGSNVLEWRTDAQARGDIGLGNVQNINWTIPRMGVATPQIDATHLPLAAGGNSGILRHDGTQTIGGSKVFNNDVTVSGNLTTAGNTTLGNASTDEVTIRGLVEFENDGSATAPTIELSNSTMGAGIYAPATDDIGFATSGVQRYGIKPNGDFVAVNASNTEDIIYDASTETIPLNRVVHSTVGTEPTVSNRKAGDFWYDVANEALMVRNAANTEWLEAGGGAGSISYSTTPPTGAEQGDLWYDCDDTGRIYVYTGSVWVDASPAGSESTPGIATVSATAPTDPGEGTMWYDEGTARMYIWNGSAWIDASPAAADPDVAAGDITAGTLDTDVLVPSANLRGALPAIDGSALTNLPGGGDSFSNVQVLASGSGNWTVPAGVTQVYAIVVQGGGGAAIRTNGNTQFQGARGNVRADVITTTPGSTIAYSVGTGGAGVEATGGTPSTTTGGHTTFGTLSSSGSTGFVSTDASELGTTISLFPTGISSDVVQLKRLAPNTSRTATESTSALTFSTTGSYAPGARGLGIQRNSASGGVGGAVLLFWA